MRTNDSRADFFVRCENEFKEFDPDYANKCDDVSTSRICGANESDPLPYKEDENRPSSLFSSSQRHTLSKKEPTHPLSPTCRS